MPKYPNLEAGRWWRFDRYRIRDGLIEPAPRARLVEYDPWDSFRELRSSRGIKQPRHLDGTGGTDEAGGEGLPPYQSLIKLMREIRKAPASRDELVTTWCGKHGLLGSLPHRLQRVVFEPRWKRFTGPAASIGRKGSKRIQYYAPVLDRYYRTAAGWRSTVEEHRAAARTGRLSVEEAVPPELIPQSWSEAGVEMNPEFDDPFLSERLPLDKLCRFFPASKSAPTPKTIPLPGTEHFRRAYAEPLSDFLNAAERLESAAVLLSMPDDRVHDGVRIARALAAPVNVTLIAKGGGQFEYRWASPSLLGTYAMMLVQHLTHPRAATSTCQVCGIPFISANYQATYCSRRCRKTQNQRGRRARRRKARGST